MGPGKCIKMISVSELGKSAINCGLTKKVADLRTLAVQNCRHAVADYF